jgi:hypothetical protein
MTQSHRCGVADSAAPPNGVTRHGRTAIQSAEACDELTSGQPRLWVDSGESEHCAEMVVSQFVRRGGGTFTNAVHN